MFTFTQIMILLLILATMTIAAFLFGYYAGRNSREELEPLQVPGPFDRLDLSDLSGFKEYLPKKKPEEQDPNGKPLNPMWQ